MHDQITQIIAHHYDTTVVGLQSRCRKQKQIEGSGTLEIFTEGKQSKTEFRKNKKALTILANNEGKYRMLPLVNDGKPNPDAYNLQKKCFVDVKVVTTNNGKMLFKMD